MADALFTFVASSVKHESEKAFLFVIEGVEVWMPKSQIRDCDVSSEAVDQEVKITEWIAQQKGMMPGGEPAEVSPKQQDLPADDDIPF
jgi:hypothetical protein